MRGGHPQADKSADHTLVLGRIIPQSWTCFTNAFLFLGLGLIDITLTHTVPTIVWFIISKEKKNWWWVLQIFWH